MEQKLNDLLQFINIPNTPPLLRTYYYNFYNIVNALEYFISPNKDHQGNEPSLKQLSAIKTEGKGCCLAGALVLRLLYIDFPQ